jgi:integral membrane protein (TIGR00529 family)
MFDVAALALVFALIVLLLRRKMKVGHVMLAASAFLALLSLMPPRLILRTIGETVTEPVTVKLILALALIRMLEKLLRERHILREMMEAVRGLIPSRRAHIVSMPLLIGMLPSVGGAYFSAPMVEEATRGLEMPPEEKGFVNYLFRHPWELILPLYPRVVLASAITDVDLRSLILANLPAAAAMALAGLALSMRRLGKKEAARRVSGRRLASFLPIGSVLLLVMVFRVELALAMLVVVAGLAVFFRTPLRSLGGLLRHGFSLDVVVLITGVMLFKNTMEHSGSVEGLSLFFAERGIPLLPTLLVLPFVTGVLTGLTIGFVGATFPLIVSLTGAGAVVPVSMAFAAGFAGVLLSPVHVCLILTREYFGADMAGMYRRVLHACLVVMAVAVLQYLLLA